MICAAEVRFILFFAKTIVFMGASIAFMMLALVTGIFRLMSLNSLSTGMLVEVYRLHSFIMVFGFLATIIMTERGVGVALIPGGAKIRSAIAMVPLTVSGVTVETVGYTLSLPFFTVVGAILLILGCVSFILTLRFLRNTSGAKLPFDFMLLAVIALLGAATISAFTVPANSVGFVMLLITFPILFILGERVELTTYTSTAVILRRFSIAFGIACMSVAFFLLGSGGFLPGLSSIIYFYGSLLLMVVFLLVLTAENQNFRRLLRSTRPIQRYVSIHVRIAYGWGIFGMILAVAFSLNIEPRLYDAFIHSLTVGFVGTMMLAHGPVILPSLLRKGFQDTKLSLAPLSVLTLAIFLRVSTELSLLVFNWITLRLLAALSGWLVLAAVLLFLLQMISGIKETI